MLYKKYRNDIIIEIIGTTIVRKKSSTQLFIQFAVNYKPYWGMHRLYTITLIKSDC